MSYFYKVTSLLATVVAFWLSAAVPVANAQDCGSPPAHVEVSSDFARHWTLYTCSQMNLATGATVPIEGIPVTFSLTDEERTCTESTETVEEHRRYIMRYLATRESLLIAECGYRLCEMRRARADSAVMAVFTHMCGMGFADTSGSSPSASISVADPHQSIVWSETTAGTMVDIDVSVRNHNPGVDLRYRAGRVSPGRSGRLMSASSGSLGANAVTNVTIRVRIPTRRPLRGEPVYIPYRVEVRAGGGVRAAHVSGTVMVYASTDESRYAYCTDWSHDMCVQCEVPLSASATSGSCGGMPEGDASISFSGRALARGLDAEHDTWIAVDLDSGSAFDAWCNGNPGGHHRGVGCVGPFSGSRGVRVVTMNIPHVSVPASGLLEATTGFSTCVAAPGGCDLVGTLTFRSLVTVFDED